MSELRPLRGGCQCGRNRYIISIPHDRLGDAQVLFNTDPVHQVPLATPLAAFLRVPLSWYQSTTYAFFPDEAHAQIRRVYTHPSQQHAKRHFCGYCGTPLSYWSEEPASEGGFISLTLGSLLGEDLRDLDDMGLIPEQSEADDQGERGRGEAAPSGSIALRQSDGVPWLEKLVDGMPLGTLRRSHGLRQTDDGSLKVEWEVVDFTADDDSDMADASASTSSSTERPGKRKMDERDDSTEQGA